MNKATKILLVIFVIGLIGIAIYEYGDTIGEKFKKKDKVEQVNTATNTTDGTMIQLEIVNRLVSILTVSFPFVIGLYILQVFFRTPEDAEEFEDD